MSLQGPDKRPDEPVPLFGRGALAALLAWGFLVLGFTAAIVESSAFWWVVPLLGAVVPTVFVVLNDRARREALAARGARSSAAPTTPGASDGERQVLDALRDRGELSPTTAAMHTSLTVDEAARVLERLAEGGHLEVLAHDGTLAYTLRERDRRGLLGVPETSSPRAEPSEETGSEEGRPPAPSSGSPRQLAEPLSERELEVLRLLATGRSNKEIAGELYVAIGTVKAHVNNVYRKLGARNRAEATSLARDLDLLGGKK